METSTFTAVQPAAHLSAMVPAERKAAGKRRRDTVARNEHAAWRARPDRADPIGILRAADATRQPDLVPLRYGAAIAVHVLSRVCRRHGRRSRPHAGERPLCPGPATAI